MHVESDDYLVRYLLGELPDDEAEPLDERSVTDEEFALRLRAIENDLVDRYAAGGPLDSTLERFDRVYRSSRHLHDKVMFAQALSGFARTANRAEKSERSAAQRWVGSRGLAAAAVVLLAVSGYLGTRTMRLAEQITELDARRAAVEQRNSSLTQELAQTLAKQSPQPPAPVEAAFLLHPPRRGLAADVTTVAIPRGAERVTLRLQVESADRGSLWVALRDPSTRRVIWRSGDLTAEAAADARLVAVSIPASLFSNQRYFIDLSEIPAGGAAELIATYVIRVVLE
jgi:hypothetical protein